MKFYELKDNGFTIRLDMKLYERKAVIKALYRFHNSYIISYEIDGDYLWVDFESYGNDCNYIDDVAAIMKELDFQMIRIDTIRQTKGIRELLVARALYATCIETERDKIVNDNDEKKGWHEDQLRIFSSWSMET